MDYVEAALRGQAAEWYREALRVQLGPEEWKRMKKNFRYMFVPLFEKEFCVPRVLDCKFIGEYPIPLCWRKLGAVEADEFLNIVKSHKTHHGWSEEETMRHVESALRWEANDWFQAQ